MYLREFREKLNLTQRELSNALGITQVTIARYETGKMSPTSTVLLKYINELNANPNYLFLGEGDVFLSEQRKINSLGAIVKEAKIFIKTFNKETERVVIDCYNALDDKHKKDLPLDRIIQDISDKLALSKDTVLNVLKDYLKKKERLWKSNEEIKILYAID